MRGVVVGGWVVVEERVMQPRAAWILGLAFEMEMQMVMNDTDCVLCIQDLAYVS